ncbi:MAG: hypothetical protein VX642_12855 [Bdellovibrionota bacterium]|nr:hypothetical protein [Bdellovibrionota bacterium]
MSDSRRDFLKFIGRLSSLGMSTPAINTLVNSMISAYSQKAMAATSNDNFYVFIQETQGPERWFFDLFLDPYNSGYTPGLQTPENVSDSSVTKNLGLVNSYYKEAADSSYDKAVYRFADVNGIRAPHLWSLNTGSSDGGSRAISELMQNLFSIRGIDVGSENHTTAKVLIEQPSIGGPTLTGLMADYTSSPINAFAINPSYSPYVSTKNKSRLNIGKSRTSASNMADVLLKPFNGVASAGNSANRVAYDEFNQLVGKSLKNYKDLGKATNLNVNSAKDLMYQGVSSLSSSWSSVYLRYKNIIDATIALSLPYLTDHPIGSDPNTRVYQSGGKTIKDLRYQVGAGSGIILENDLRTLLQKDRFAAAHPSSSFTSNLYYMAEIFSITEFAIKNNFSQSIHLNSTAFHKLQADVFNGGFTSELPNSSFSSFTYSFDVHNSGSMLNVLLMNAYYMCLAGCLLELRDQLIAKSLWNKTVIQISGDFNRRPIKDGSGSDHAGHATSMSVFSGKVKSPIFAGKIKNSSNTKYPGYYGTAAENSNGQTLNLGNVASSVASMLEIPSPSPNNVSLVSVASDGIQLNNEFKAENIKDEDV